MIFFLHNKCINKSMLCPDGLGFIMKAHIAFEIGLGNNV